MIRALRLRLPDKLIIDSGYCSSDTIEACEQRGIDAYISQAARSTTSVPRPSRGPAPRDLNARGLLDRKIRSKASQAIYALRKAIVEPVFG